jgi:hypothetical protein
MQTLWLIRCRVCLSVGCALMIYGLAENEANCCTVRSNMTWLLPSYLRSLCSNTPWSLRPTEHAEPSHRSHSKLAAGTHFSCNNFCRTICEKVWKILYSPTCQKWQYNACALHAAYKRGEQVPSNTTSFNYKHTHLRATCFDLYQSSSCPFNKIIKNTDLFI